MHIFDYLKDVVPLESRKGCVDFDLQVKSTSSTKKYLVDNNAKTIVIYINNLSPKEKRTFSKGIKAVFDKGDLLLVERNKLSLLETLYAYSKQNNKDNQTLAFFQPILSKRDFEALRDSLFLRDEFIKGGNSVSSLKHDIAVRYGERGNIISNLCTAGYFEEVMMDLYNLKPDHTDFYNYYDIAVDRGLTALFVNVGMTVSKIEGEINRRINSAKQYGLSYIHIHGIGKTNIGNIQKCIKKVKSNSNFNFTEKNVFTTVGLPILVVEIIF